MIGLLLLGVILLATRRARLGRRLTVIATILLVGGLQLIGLGLIGEYLGRAYLKLNRKPQYVVRETTEGMAESSSTRDAG